jgi:hypothetical protein
MNIKKIYVALSVVCLVAAMADMSWRRYVWATFAFAFLFGADAIKDVEKVKRKAEDLTEIRMTKQMLEGWEKSQDRNTELITNAVTHTSDSLLKQLATYIRVGTPDCTVPHHTQEFWDKESIRMNPTIPKDES